MSLINIAQFLEDNSVAYMGTNLFIDTMPQNVPAGVLLRQSGGYLDPYYCGQLRESKFQAVISHDNYPNGLTLAEKVMSVLQIRQQSIGTGFYYMVYPESEPLPFGRESSGKETFVINFVAKWRQL